MWMCDKGFCSNNLFNIKVLMNFQNWKFMLNGSLLLEALISMKFLFGHINLNKFLFQEILILMNFHFWLFKFQWISILGNFDFNKFPVLVIQISINFQFQNNIFNGLLTSGSKFLIDFLFWKQKFSINFQYRKSSKFLKESLHKCYIYFQLQQDHQERGFWPSPFIT